MTAYLPPMIRFQPLVAGACLPGGSVYFYAAGTTTPQAVYAADGTTPLSNPLVLDANGATDFRLGDGLSYKILVKDSTGATVTGWPVDQVASEAAATQLRTNLANTSNIAMGDAMIGVKQPFTGAVARTQHGKNSDFLSGFDGGMVGDLTATYDIYGTPTFNPSAADNTAALQALITYAEDNADQMTWGPYSPGSGPCEIFIPSGSYKVTDTLLVHRKVTIRGEGASEFSAGTRIRQCTNAKDLIKVSLNNGGSSFGLRDISLSTASTGVGYLVNVTTGPNSPTTPVYCNSQRYEGVTFVCPSSKAMYLTGDDILIDNCLFDVCSTGIVLGAGSAVEGCTNIRISNNDWYEIKNAWIEAHNVRGLTMTGNTSDFYDITYSAGPIIDAYTTPWRFSNVTITGNNFVGGQYFLKMQGTTGFSDATHWACEKINITGNTFYGKTIAGVPATIVNGVDTGFGGGDGDLGNMISVYGPVRFFTLVGNNIGWRSPLVSSVTNTNNAGCHVFGDYNGTVLGLNITGNNFFNYGDSTAASYHCIDARNSTGNCYPNTYSSFPNQVLYTTQASVGHPSTIASPISLGPYGVLASTQADVPITSGTLDLAIGTMGFTGILTVSMVRYDTPGISTQRVYAVSGHGTTLVQAQLLTQSGGTGDISPIGALTIPTAGTIRWTNTAAYIVSCFMSFQGTKTSAI